MSDPIRVVANGPGIGDGVVLTALARQAKLDGVVLDVVVPHPELWTANPDVGAVSLWSDAWSERSFPEFDGPGQGKVVGHQVQAMCRKLGLSEPARRDIRPWVYLTQADLDACGTVMLTSPYVTVHCQSGRWTPNRDWVLARWALLVRQLRAAGLAVVQIGGKDDPPLAVDHDRRGLPLRQVATILTQAAAHVCPITGSMHLAAGTGTPTVVVWSAREDPAIIAYPSQRLVMYQPPQRCGPCWEVKACRFSKNVEFEIRKPCMEGIEVSDVLAAVLETARTGS